jgi:hypothetical protein
MTGRHAYEDQYEREGRRRLQLQGVVAMKIKTNVKAGISITWTSGGVT